jgi:DNA polymerase-1
MFHQVRKDEGGTRSGRFASSDPNLQQIPSRDKVWAKLIRGLFIPEESEDFGKFDYNQQEPRILTHYGFVMNLQGADTLRQAYIDDKRTDFYTLVAKTAGIERKPAKDLTLGRCYGEGVDKIANTLGIAYDAAKVIIKGFDQANPFIKMLGDMCMDAVERRGYIKTVTGRRRHFNLWEPSKLRGCVPATLNEARVKWPGHKLKVAYAYKALNALIQGTAADMTKAAMLLVYDETKRIPLLQVHDELDYSIPKDNGHTATKIQYFMENALELSVPMWAEPCVGERWS